MKATHLPLFRDNLVNRLCSSAGDLIILQRAPDQTYKSRIPGMSLRAALQADTATTCLKAELYFVTEEMTSLIASEVERAPLGAIDPDRMPAPEGLVWFEGAVPLPATEFTLESGVARFFSWRLHDGYLMIHLWGEYPDPEATFGDTWARAAEGISVSGRFVRNSTLVGYPIGTALAEAPTLVKFLALTWEMMRQEVAAVAKPAVLPIDLKRARKRHQPDPSDVRVVSLRRVHSETQKAIQEGRYHSRWIVRGHWRKQWYRSRNENSPLYIAPYIKGPDGAPLVMTQKVYKLQH